MHQAIFEHLLCCTFADKFNENAPWKCKPTTSLFNKRCVSDAPGVRSLLSLHLKCRSSGTMWVVPLVAGLSPWVSSFQGQAYCAEFVVGMREYYCVFTVWCLYVTRSSSARSLCGIYLQLVARAYHVARDKMMGCPWRDMKCQNFS